MVFSIKINIFLKKEEEGRYRPNKKKKKKKQSTKSTVKQAEIILTPRTRFESFLQVNSREI